MKTVTSSERSTKTGATRFAAVLLDGKFVRVSDMPDSRYKGCQTGVENFEVDVANDAICADFYRSNRGNETVEVDNGESFCSFDAARIERYTGDV